MAKSGEAVHNSRDDILARLERLEAVEAIGKLMADYTHYFDQGWSGAGCDASRVGAVFTEDAVWGGESGGQQGRANIEAWCAKHGHAARMSLHIAMNPHIEVTGDTATGTWTGLVPMVTPAGEAIWVGGRYECDCIKTDDGWKFSRMTFLTAFQTPYDEGFARTQFIR